MQNSSSQKTKVLITGGIGFIFSHVTEFLVKQGYDVVVIDDKRLGSHPEIINSSFRFYPNDCSKVEVQDIIIAENPDYIIHACAISDVDQSIKDPEFVLKDNILSNINVFEAARFCTNLKKLLYVSTDEIYGECEHLKTEEEILFPKNPYSVSKATGSLLRLAYGSTYHSLKEKTCEVRMCNIFGDRQDTRKIMALIKEGFATGKPIPVHNGGKGYREYLYVKNIPPIIELLLKEGHRTYNITQNDGFTVEQLIAKCEEIMGRKLNTTESHRPGMDLKYQMSGKRFKDEFNFQFPYSFEESLKDYLNA